MEIKKLQEKLSSKTQITFAIDGKIFKADIIKSDLTYTVYLQNAGHISTITIPQKQPCQKSKYSFSPAQRSVNDQELILKSPLAGLVVKIKATIGQFVEKNQPIVVIESMKMENEISAPFAAFIKTLSISEGNLVKQNQVLVTFEKKGESDAAAKKFGEPKTSQY